MKLSVGWFFSFFFEEGGEGGGHITFNYIKTKGVANIYSVNKKPVFKPGAHFKFNIPVRWGEQPSVPSYNEV